MGLPLAGGGISIPGGGLYNPSANLESAGKQFMGIADRLAKREKDRTIRDVLSAVPTVGEDGKLQSADSFRQSQLSKLLLQDNNIDPLEAMTIAGTASKPYYDTEARNIAAEKVNYAMGRDVVSDAIAGQKLTNAFDTATATAGYRANVLKETKDHNRATEGDFAGFTDEYGKTWMINKNTGAKEEINTGVGAGNMPFGGAGGKNIIMVDSTTPDGFGGKTTVKIPVDKRTGLDAQGNQPQVVNQATLSQKDKDYTKNYGQSGTTVGNVRDTLGNTGIWGGLDAYTGPIGAFFGSKEGGEQRMVKQDLENLRLEATNKLAGVLSNQDMQIILDTIPTINDQPDIARKKLAKVEKSMAQADANQFNRLVKSNPNAVKDMAIGMVNGTTPVPPGYQLVQYDDGSVSLIPK